eukprot:CAMPEP_0177584598 /NCGR_PEP_ID=MMETSP0419_2-20121207/3990_1 /TAXON_ID=582737 /ORGANISM="Tetraselmis sp., Strain GSL018" /LENGTH=658 /DNA_ID=CAMNT_0019074165 /DNA_START=483 /DNA_END=2459 /DNA_ORIENTATION=-
MSLAFFKYRRVTKYRSTIQRGQKRGPGFLSLEEVSRVTGHWTAVASSDIFRETSALISDAQVLSTLIVVPTMALAAISQVRNAVSRDAAMGEDYKSELLGACCPEEMSQWVQECSRLCQFGIMFKETFLTILTGMMVCFIVWSCVLPVVLWSPATSMAVQKTGNRVIRRVLVLPHVVVVAEVVVGSCVGIYAINGVAPALVAHTWLWSAMFLVLVFSTATLLLVLVWAFDWASLSTSARSAAQQLATFWRFAARRSWMRVLPQPNEGHDRVPFFWQCRQSHRYRTVVLLWCCVYCFAIEAVTWKGQVAPEIWVMRAALLLLLVFSRDEAADFSDLGRLGTGFGLVVDARQLRAALRRHLEGRPPARRVRRYKATLLRMQDAMAVSYRWQPEAEPVAEGLELNMTPWQMASLEDAIRRSRCLYVWIDRVSVPGSGGRLKRVLLSRMLSVYSTAFLTLVLLSRELEKDRYHQRAWTLQEYCASRQLMVRREEAAGVDAELSLRLAATDAEAETVSRIRREHMSRQAACTPVWLARSAKALMTGVDSGEAKQTWETYRELSSELHCLLEGDKVRALCPLLWNRPAESEDEIASLLRAVEEVHHIPQAEELRLLRENPVVTESRAGSRIQVFTGSADGSDDESQQSFRAHPFFVANIEDPPD